MKTIKFSKLLKENISGSKLIVVDIQPAYQKYFKNFKNKFLEDLIEFNGKVLYLYNGPNLGYNDDEFSIEQWIREETDDWDVDLSNIEFIEKGYGFLRDAIDMGVNDDDIINILKYMLKNKIWDSRDIDWKEYSDIDFNEFDEFESENVSIGLPQFDIKIFNRYKGASICGGEKNECLTEVQLLLQAMNIKTKEIKKYIY